MAQAGPLSSLEEDDATRDLSKDDITGTEVDYDFTAPFLKTHAFDLGRSEDSRIDKERISDLQAQIVRLRNDLEKGETVRQQLEYELAVNYKTLKTRSKEIGGLELELSRRDSEHELELEHLRHDMRERERRLEEDKNVIERASAAQKDRLEEVEERMVRLRNALEEKMEESKRLMQEKSSVSSEVEVLEGKLEDLREKFVAMSEQCQSLRAEMADRNGDFAALRARESLSRQELQATLGRCRQLEEAAEREKAGQLEHRFNGELVQLKLREAESQLQAERHAKAEAVQLMEDVTRRLHEMETALEEEKQVTMNYRQEFEKLRSEHLNSRSCITEELEEKRKNAGQMREQLERQREELEATKETLAKAQDDISQKDERHRKLAMELALLLDKSAPGAEGGDPAAISRARRNLDAEGMVEELRKAALAQRKSASSISDDLSKQRSQAESATREARSLREQVRAKEKALQLETEKNNNSVQELRVLKKKLVDADRRVSDLRAAHSEQKRRLEKAAEENQSQKEELQRVRRGRRAELESACYGTCATIVPSFSPKLDGRSDCASDAVPELNSPRVEDEAGPDVSETEEDRSSNLGEPHELSSMEIEPEEDRQHFLTDLNSRLTAFEAVQVSGAIAPRPVPKAPTVGDSSREASWTDLKGSVSEQLAGVLSSLERQNDKIHHLEECVRGKERFIDDLRLAHETQMKKYDSLNQTFSLQKKELEEHYNKLIQDMQTKSKCLFHPACSAGMPVLVSNKPSHGFTPIKSSSHVIDCCCSAKPGNGGSGLGKD